MTPKNDRPHLKQISETTRDAWDCWKETLQAVNFRHAAFTNAPETARCPRPAKTPAASFLFARMHGEENVRRYR